jgi:hypothetical protein
VRRCRRGGTMRIAAYDDHRLGVVGADDTVVDVTDLF